MPTTFSKKKLTKPAKVKKAMAQNQMVGPNQSEMAAMLKQNQVMQQPGNLVEMPILSEEFLNQLNEEQLQALLEQQ